jgi:hypothetical protein
LIVVLQEQIGRRSPFVFAANGTIYMAGHLFELGILMATPGALAAVTESRLRECLHRHQIGDWGGVCAADASENDLSVVHGFRILSCYPIDPATAL